MTDWPVKTLGDVCELSTGGTPSTGNKSYYDGGQIKWLRSGDVHQREIHDCDGRITEEGMRNANTRFLPLNSVLIALAGQGKTRGTVAMLRTKATCNQSVVSIMPVDLKLLLPEFVFWNLHMKYDEIRRMTGDDGNDRRGLNMRLIRSMTVPVAPLEEQKRIVALLDSATARITELTACYEQARIHANNMFTSALQDSLESNPDWPVKTLGAICEVFDDGDWIESKDQASSGVRLIQTGNVGDGEFKDRSEKARFISESTFSRLRCTEIFPGDLLVSRLPDPVGRACLIPDTGSKMITAVDCTIMRPRKDLMLPQFLVCLTQTSVYREQVRAKITGTTRDRISRNNLAEVKVRMPPLDEQKRIVARLDSMKAKTSEMVAAYDAKLTAAKNLRQSILEAAFAGDL